jgi:hypothetical protein
MDAIAAAHPGFEDSTRALAAMDRGERTAFLTRARARNETSASVQDRVVSYVATLMR